jgi:hypothetical protein
LASARSAISNSRSMRARRGSSSCPRPSARF